MHGRALAEFRQRERRILNMPAHSEIGTIDLEHDGRGDGFVFLAHRVRDREQIGLLGGVMIIAEEKRYKPRRSRTHEPGW